MSKARDIVKGTATSLAGGVTGAVPYQSNTGATAMTAAGTTGQILTTVTTGAAPTWQIPTGTQKITTTVIPTVGQTVFTITYIVGYIDVFYNGIKLVINDDFVATNGTSVTFSSATIADDVVEFVTFTNMIMSASLSGDVTSVDNITTLANSGVTAGNYTNTNLTVDSKGRITVAANGGGASALTILSKTAAYTVVAGDIGKIINCSGAAGYTISLTAAATLGSGFNCWIWNTTTAVGSMDITIDPNLTETIDGLTTRILRMGEGTEIISDGVNWQTGAKKTMRGYAERFGQTLAAPIATGGQSVAIGYLATASGSSCIAIGAFSTSSGVETFATGRSTASALYSTAIGEDSVQNGSQAVTGAGAMALGGSYASGTDSFAAAIKNNTTPYGATGASAVAIGTNAKATGNATAVAIGANCIASGNGSTAIGYGTTAGGGGNGAVAIGNSCNASGGTSFAFGYGCTTDASYQTAIGNGSAGAGAIAATGAGAMALGNSYASGADSFAANISNNTSSYGAQGVNSIAMGFRATATGNYSVAISSGSLSEKAVASGSGSMILGQGVASGGASLCLGTSVFAESFNKTAMSGVTYSNTAQAEGQLGMMSLWAATTNATPVQLQTGNGALQAIYLPTLYNNSAVYFKGTVVARQQAVGGTASAAWTIEGLIRKEGTLLTTTMVASTVTVISNVPAWAITVAADTTFGAIKVMFTGAAATNIRVLCNLQMTELNNYS